jgi:salicylate hydroxylase
MFSALQMFPTTGQGGSQSLEDVGALGILLSNIQHKSVLPDILQIYEKLRKERMTVVQGTSGITFGYEDTFARERPWHIINAAGIKSGEDHLKYLYQ